MAKLRSRAYEQRPKKYRKHSPAGYAYLMEQQREKQQKGKKIAYYGQGRETADVILRRLKRKK